MLALIGALLALAPPAAACHGPGTAAGGVQVWSARPIARGAFAVLLRADFTQFESLSPDEIEEKTLEVSGDHAATFSHFIRKATLFYTPSRARERYHPEWRNVYGERRRRIRSAAEAGTGLDRDGGTTTRQTTRGQ